MIRRDYHNMISFPYGLSNFKKNVGDGDYYVNKTYCIELMELWGDDLKSFLRPRRIGKSLFVSILAMAKNIKMSLNISLGSIISGRTPPN